MGLRKQNITGPFALGILFYCSRQYWVRIFSAHNRIYISDWGIGSHFNKTIKSSSLPRKYKHCFGKTLTVQKQDIDLTRETSENVHALTLATHVFSMHLDGNNSKWLQTLKAWEGLSGSIISSPPLGLKRLNLRKRWRAKQMISLHSPLHLDLTVTTLWACITFFTTWVTYQAFILTHSDACVGGSVKRMTSNENMVCTLKIFLW